MSDSSKNPLLKTINYFKDVRREAKFITWPPFRQVVYQCFVVLALSSILTGLLYCIDLGLMQTINQLKHLIQK